MITYTDGYLLGPLTTNVYQFVDMITYTDGYLLEPLTTNVYDSL
jgi:hypothetical protein